MVALGAPRAFFGVWSPDGKWLITSGWAGTEVTDVLLRVPAEGGAARPLLKSPSNAATEMAPAFSPDGRTLAFSRLLGWARSEICLLPLSAAMEPEGEVRTLNTGSAWNTSPAWMPDGRRIAFTAPGPRGSSIFLIDGPAAAPRPVPGAERCGYLDWSSDGKAIFYSSGSGSNYDVWKIAAEGGEPVRMTFDRGRVPSASSDGRYLYYLKLAGADGRNDLWRLPLGGGREEKVLEFVDAYSLGDTGIAFKFYRPGERPEGPFLEFHSFATGKTERLPAASRPLRYGIALSRDGRRLLHAQADYDVSDLMLVDLPPTWPTNFPFDCVAEPEKVSVSRLPLGPVHERSNLPLICVVKTPSGSPGLIVENVPVTGQEVGSAGAVQENGKP